MIFVELYNVGSTEARIAEDLTQIWKETAPDVGPDIYVFDHGLGSADRKVIKVTIDSHQSGVGFDQSLEKVKKGFKTRMEGLLCSTKTPAPLSIQWVIAE